MRIKSLILVIGLIVALGAASTADAAVYLSLQPSVQDVGVGSEFTLNMNLTNSSSEQLSFLNIWLSFDPTYLEVVDSDTGNWKTAGTNVLDGPYHGVFNWDFHGQNTADNGTGRISYGEGSFSSVVTGSGTFAQIKFLAKANALSTPINYLVTGTGGIDDTYVTGDVTNILGGVNGATVNVIPEPASMLLLGTGLVGLLGLSRKKR